MTGFRPPNNITNPRGPPRQAGSSGAGRSWLGRSGSCGAALSIFAASGGVRRRWSASGGACGVVLTNSIFDCNHAKQGADVYVWGGTGHVFAGNTFAGGDCGNNGSMIEVLQTQIDWSCQLGM